MKNYIFIFASLMIFSFFSCENEDSLETSASTSENVNLKSIVLETEPNNVVADADAVSNNDRYTGIISVAGDIDWGYFDITENGTNITFELQSNTGYCTVYVYNSLLETVATINDNIGDFLLLNQPRGRYTFNASGYANTYYSLDIHF
jgi:hypothetical protein